MQWLKRLIPPRSVAPASLFDVVVRCDACGRTIRTRLNLLNDLSELDQPGHGAQYFVRKTLVDDRCFRRIGAEFHFSRERRLISSEVIGGTLLDSGQ